ncbi:MAG: molybdopterin-dependent oxidoreductase [Castellaniella sp.]|uniref:molybdopterin-dependent oxidoreductase n=1 Tax=Castellaniella sp. TaxID=1955812 RepID=UPI003A879D0B
MKFSLWRKDNAEAVVTEARALIQKQLPQVSRRRFLARGLTLGGVGLLSGCVIDNNATAEAALTRISQFNDWAQGKLFDPSQLAPTYPDAMITRPFPFNAFYGEDQAPQIDGEAFRLEVSGLVTRKRPWSLRDLRDLPQYTQVTRHICVEGWSAIGKWSGPRLGDFLVMIGADMRARYIGVHCSDDYYTSIDMATAMHPQTLIALDWNDAPLPPKYGFPMKLRIPTKLGYKNPKHVQAIFVSNTFNRGYWEDQGYNWFGGS